VPDCVTATPKLWAELREDGTLRQHFGDSPPAALQGVNAVGQTTSERQRQVAEVVIAGFARGVPGSAQDVHTAMQGGSWLNIRDSDDY
jgi:hypothetical protein